MLQQLLYIIRRFRGYQLRLHNFLYNFQTIIGALKMKNAEPSTEEATINNAFLKHAKINVSSQQNSKSQKVKNSKMNVDSDPEQEDMFQAMKAKQTAKESMNNTTAGKQNAHNNSSRKRVPESDAQLGQKSSMKMEMEIEPKRIKMLSFGQLQQEINFYLTEVYQFAFTKLYVTGVMQNGQTINIIANQTYRQLYFALKKQEFETQELSEDFLKRAKLQIDEKFQREGVKVQYADFQKKKYVFQIDGICRSQRPYYKVRYSYENRYLPQPDDQGEYYKYVIGTTYTPLQLFILNVGLKGPSWVKVNKNFLTQTKKYTEGGLCAQTSFIEGIEVPKDYNKPPFLRVMSISLKAAIPSHLGKKQLFPNTNRIDENHIYCLSYTYCEEYQVELKPAKYSSEQKTFNLKSFGNLNQKGSQSFETQIQMIGKFIADINRLDPDVIVCHDASKIIDVLIQRLSQLGEKNLKPKLGRLVHHYNVSSQNQYQRIGSSLAGRLLVDTFIHSKDMIKSIDYELHSMATHIKPQISFVGMSEEQVKNNLDTNKSLYVLKKIKDQADVTFALMNHLQVLQLSRQLSNICGNLWKRSLENQRAQRNQFLIMHQCIRKSLIIPDKFKVSKNQQDGEQVDRKKYTGGMVIEPKKGMYNDFIILLDFNSLYPSIIRQYNVCFSILDRPRIPLSKFYKSKKTGKQIKKNDDSKINHKKNDMNDEAIDINPPPKELCTKQKWGFLPRLIDGIVNQRQKCKKAMKNASAQKCIILDIQQKSYKIVANSIYGCLGFNISRFYCKPMAALITRMGREALQKANDIVSARGGVEVIYGDTDSLMIQPTSLNKDTDKQKIFQIKAIADDLKKSINKEYSNLQIDIDGVFKPILLLMKKKYVANKLQNFQKIIAGIQNDPKYHLQFKGIEVVRRDGCQIARSSLKKILQILMNSNKNEVQEIYEDIYDYARQLKQKLGEISHKDFLFTKQLNKKPKQYSKGQTIPHVKVALDRMKNGQKEETLVNHTIYYLVCKPKLESQDALAKRCFDDRTYQKSQKYANDPDQKLQIDIEYYKQEILQPWMRIFMHLQQFNEEKLFEAFDVKDADRKKIRKQMNSERDEVENGLQDFLTNDMMQKSKKFNDQINDFSCAECKNNLNFCKDGLIKTKCEYCPFDNTKQMTAALSNKILMWIKQKSYSYYSNKQKCECQKVYPLTLISKCCRVQLQKKTIIPFQIHTFIYMAKELIQVTINSLSKQIVKKKQNNEDSQKNQIQTSIQKLQKINTNILEKFLRCSDYQNLQGVFDMFRN